MSDARDFLTALFDDAPPDLFTLLWTRADKRSHWHTVGDIDALVAKVDELQPDHDVYVATTLTSQAGGSYQRWLNDETAGMVGLWADIDFGVNTDAHQKINYPPDESAAHTVLDSCGLKPSIVIHSGHGLQAWWLLEEPLLFTDLDELAAGHSLIRGWQQTLLARAIERSWTLDSTHDLSRVLRVPGTFNRKIEADVVPVVTQFCDAAIRYSVEDFEGHMLDESYLRSLNVSPIRQYVVGDITLSENAGPDPIKLSLLGDIEPKFKASWERKRKDLGDESASSYDMSLATYAAMAGWSDQEIVNLLIGSRRLHGDDLKLRASYYVPTIARARAAMERESAADIAEEVVEDLRTAKESGDVDEEKVKRRAVLDAISAQLGVETLGVIRYGTDPGVFALRSPSGEIHLGESGEVISWNKMRAKVADATRYLIPRFKNNDWDQIIQLIFEAAEHEDVGIEATEAGQVYSWLVDYISTHPPLDNASTAFQNRYPYTDGSNDTFFFPNALRDHIYLGLNITEKIRPREFSLMLKRYGCESKTVGIALHGIRSTRSVWKVPPLIGRAVTPDETDDE